jgi:hypothetical protein
MTEIAFDKYAMKGGYHWREYFGLIRRISASTLKLCYNAFSRPAGFRVWSAQMAVVRKPCDLQT